jgi:hypothetical protein
MRCAAERRGESSHYVYESNTMQRHLKLAPQSTILPWALLLIGAPILIGCGPSEPFDYVKVAGKVTYDDGSVIPAERLQVIFVSQAPPLDAKTQPRPGHAEVNVADGTFDTVTSHKYGDGLVPGKHKVQVIAMDKMQRPTKAVPKLYESPATTPLIVDTADAPFHIQIAKPQ